MTYSTVPQFTTSYPRLEKTQATSATLLSWLGRADNLINAYIKDAVATVPVSPAPPLLVGLSEDIAYVMFLRRHIHDSGKETGLQKSWEDSMVVLQGIRDGTISLVNSAGVEITVTAQGVAPWADVTGYAPTFSPVRDIADALIDGDRVDAEDSIRD